MRCDFKGWNPAETNMTYHQVVGWVAELAGCNAWCDENGELNLSWYGDSQLGLQMLFTKGDYFTIERSEDDVRITGVEYNDSNDTTYIVGTDEYSLIIEANPLLQDNHSTVLTNIYNKVSTITWQPMPTLDSLSYPHLWPGDFIFVESDDLIAGGETLADIVPSATASATMGVATNAVGVYGGSLIPYNSARQGVFQIIPSATTSAQIAPITNDSGVVGANITPYIDYRFGTVITKHNINTKSKLVSCGESMTSFSYASSTPLTAQQIRVIKSMIAP
jgi:hypothetical protein